LQLVGREEPGPARLLSLLDRLEEPPDASTHLLSAGGTVAEHRPPGDPPLLYETLDLLADSSGRFPSGMVLFWSPERAYAVRPPLPPPASERLKGWDTAPLLDLLGRPRVLGILLLRRGGFSTGVFEGDVLVASKTGTRFVKNRHRKGGQSQRRFDRIREKQIDELFEKTCEAAWEKLGPFLPRLDAVFLGGDRRTVQAFRHDCDRLSRFGSKLQARFITTPEPRQEMLRQAYDMIWRSEWTVLEGDESHGTGGRL
jgi:hypothetical protein